MIRKVLNSKIIHFVSALVEWIIGIVLVILVGLTLFQNVSKQGDFFGYRVYIVGSESMVPLYYVGDTLLVKEMPIEKIEIGDTVTYVGKQEEIEGMIITHQLKNKEMGSNGEYLLHIKGIANDVEDPIVHEDQILGKVVYKFVVLSFLGKIVTNTFLTITCITVPIVLLILIEIFKLIFKKDSNLFVEESDIQQEEIVVDKKIEEKKSKIQNYEDIIEVQEEEKIKDELTIKVGNEILELPKKKTSIKLEEEMKQKNKDNVTAVKIEEIEELVDGKNK